MKTTKSLIAVVALLTTLTISRLPAQSPDDGGGTTRPRTCDNIYPQPSGTFCNPFRVHGTLDQLTTFGFFGIAPTSPWYRVWGFWENPAREVREPYLTPGGQQYTGSFMSKIVSQSDYNVYIYVVHDNGSRSDIYWRAVPGNPGSDLIGHH